MMVTLVLKLTLVPLEEFVKDLTLLCVHLLTHVTLLVLAIQPQDLAPIQVALMVMDVMLMELCVHQVTHVKAVLALQVHLLFAMLLIVVTPLELVTVPLEHALIHQRVMALLVQTTTTVQLAILVLQELATVIL